MSFYRGLGIAITTTSIGLCVSRTLNIRIALSELMADLIHRMISNYSLSKKIDAERKAAEVLHQWRIKFVTDDIVARYKQVAGQEFTDVSLKQYPYYVAEIDRQIAQTAKKRKWLLHLHKELSQSHRDAQRIFNKYGCTCFWRGNKKSLASLLAAPLLFFSLYTCPQSSRRAVPGYPHLDLLIHLWDASGQSRSRRRTHPHSKL